MSGTVQAAPYAAPKNILYATDFSPCSQAAIPFLRHLARKLGTTIHAVHVVAPEPMIELPLDLPPELDADRSVAQSALKEIFASEEFRGLSVRMHVQRGDLWPVLSSIMQAENVDMVIAGTRGRQGVSKLLLGSVAEEIFRMSRCPVLTVGPHCHWAQDAPAEIATILFATDFSSASWHGLRYAVGLTQSLGARLVLAHAVLPSAEILPASLGAIPEAVEVSQISMSDVLKESKEQLEEICARECTLTPRATAVVECGPPAEVIVTAAQNEKADLIIMDAHGTEHSTMAAHLPWSTASSVVCRAHCPVLTVRS